MNSATNSVLRAIGYLAIVVFTLGLLWDYIVFHRCDWRAVATLIIAILFTLSRSPKHVEK